MDGYQTEIINDLIDRNIYEGGDKTINETLKLTNITHDN